MVYQISPRLPHAARDMPACGVQRKSDSRLLTAGASIALSGCVSTSEDPLRPSRRQSTDSKVTGSPLSPAAIGTIGQQDRSRLAARRSVNALSPSPNSEERRRDAIPAGVWPFKKKDPPANGRFLRGARHACKSRPANKRWPLEQYEESARASTRTVRRAAWICPLLDRQGHKVKATEYYLRAVKAYPNDASVGE